MDRPPIKNALSHDFYIRLKWLMVFRVIFAALLLGSTTLYRASEAEPHFTKPLILLYALITSLFFLSFLYAIITPRIKRRELFAYIQISVDTLTVSFIIFLTGGFSSFFPFLYLVVIIYASMLLFKRGSLIIAVLSSIQYGIMIDLEYFGFITPFGMEVLFSASDYAWNHVIHKIVVIILACFAVALLSSLLSEQARKSKKELKVMEDHVKRVDKMAAIGEMAAGLAHEIKNPIASLRGSIQILREEVDHESSQEKLMQIIMREADRLSTLVNDFLMFARPAVGRMEIVDLGKSLLETLELFEKDNTSPGKTVIHKDVDDNVWVEIDAVHLRQILWNLLLNASEAISENGNIWVNLRTTKNGHAILQIIDDGCGISETDIHTIFDPFFTTKAHGTGLGLSIVHRILETSGGILNVESEPGKKTVFTLKLKRSSPPTKA